MKKFLYLSYYYPPILSIASMRSWKLAKYIREFGWEPIVLASESDSREWGYPLPDVCVHRIKNSLFMEGATRNAKSRLLEDRSSMPRTLPPSLAADFAYRTARRAKRALQEVFAFPDDFGDWRKKALDCARNLVAKGNIDLILSSSGPFSSHMIASTLSKETGIPWVADFRDLWSLNHATSRTPIRQAIEKSFEKSVVKSAPAIITVSDPLSDTQKALMQREVETITNGYDAEDYEIDVKTDSTFSIIYTGMIYEGKQNPSPLFDAVRLLLGNGQINKTKLELHFYGTDGRHLANLLQDKGISDMVHIHGNVPFDESVRRQKAATVLLFLNWTDPREKGMFSGKIFEYLGARRPVLALSRNPDSVVDRLMEKTRAGVVLDTPEEIASTLTKWYDLFYATGNLSYEGGEAEILRYDRKNQARQFAEVFDGVVYEKTVQPSL